MNEALTAGVRRELEALGAAARDGLRVARVDGAGHMLHLETPAEVGAVVGDFLLS